MIRTWTSKIAALESPNHTVPRMAQMMAGNELKKGTSTSSTMPLVHLT